MKDLNLYLAQSFRLSTWLACLGLVILSMNAQDLADIKKAGVIRHLGIPYANFVTGAEDGFDVELVQKFAVSLGVKYQYVRTDWGTLVGDLTGQTAKAKGQDAEITGQAPIKGDIGASGITIIPWRKKVMNFSEPELPTQVWLIARADSAIRPIKPTGSLDSDIVAVKSLLAGHSLYCKSSTCLDPSLYDIAATKAEYKLFPGALNELAPAIIKGEAELTLLDVPDTIVALQKWPGAVKILGPISSVQEMGVTFRKESPELLKAFNQFLTGMKADGSYRRLMEKYYPIVFDYFPDFFRTPPANGTKRTASAAP